MNDLKVIGMYVIRDTLTENVMTGAKGQYMFDSDAAPRRSVAHTGWFPEWQFREYVRSLGHTYEVELLEQAEEELTRLRAETDEDTNWGSPIRKHIDRLTKEVGKKGNRYSSEATAFAKKHSFAKQTRFVVEKVVHLTSEPIPKKGK
jgi:hypothetical protein